MSAPPLPYRPLRHLSVTLALGFGLASLPGGAAHAAPEATVLCAETGGTWNDCGSGCGPATCADPSPGPFCPTVCVSQCECPADAPLWNDVKGCVAKETCGDPAVPPAKDADGDGYSVDGGDCDDADASIHPKASEACDGLDNDCDGIVDEGCDPEPGGGGEAGALCAETGGTWKDCGSGCGPATCDNPTPGPICPTVCVSQCLCPAKAPLWHEAKGCIAEEHCPAPATEDADGDGFPVEKGDCDDDDPTIHPKAEEVCDALDNDCDGVVDEGCDGPVSDPDVALCDASGGTWTDCGSGCGPATCAEPAPGPDCPRVCIAQCECPADAPLWDDDAGCIPKSDCGAEPPPPAEDLDGDGFGVDEGDCDDGDATIHPEAGDACGDGVDNDCDGIIDPDCDDPADPGDPTDPTDPEDPEDPADPGDPEDPEDPPADGTDPGDPDGGDDPGDGDPSGDGDPDDGSAEYVPGAGSDGGSGPSCAGTEAGGDPWPLGLGLGLGLWLVARRRRR